MTPFYPVPVSTLVRPEAAPVPAARRGAPPAGFFPTHTVPILNTPRQGARMSNSSSPSVLLAARLFGLTQ